MYGGVESEACVPVRLGVCVCVHAHVGVIPESALKRFLGETHKVRNYKTLINLVNRVLFFLKKRGQSILMAPWWLAAI